MNDKSIIFFKASRCLRELEVPHFHHELIYEVIFFFVALTTLLMDNQKYCHHLNTYIPIFSQLHHQKTPAYPASYAGQFYNSSHGEEATIFKIIILVVISNLFHYRLGDFAYRHAFTIYLCICSSKRDQEEKFIKFLLLHG